MIYFLVNVTTKQIVMRQSAFDAIAFLLGKDIKEWEIFLSPVHFFLLDTDSNVAEKQMLKEQKIIERALYEFKVLRKLLYDTSESD